MITACTVAPITMKTNHTDHKDPVDIVTTETTALPTLVVVTHCLITGAVDSRVGTVYKIHKPFLSTCELQDYLCKTLCM